MFPRWRAGTEPAPTLAEDALRCEHKKSAGLHHTPVRSTTTSTSLWEACALNASLLRCSVRASCENNCSKLLLVSLFEVVVRLAIEQMKYRAFRPVEGQQCVLLGPLRVVARCKSTKSLEDGKEKCRKICTVREKCLSLQRQYESFDYPVNVQCDLLRIPRGQALIDTTHLKPPV